MQYHRTFFLWGGGLHINFSVYLHSIVFHKCNNRIKFIHAIWGVILSRCNVSYCQHGGMVMLVGKVVAWNKIIRSRRNKCAKNVVKMKI